MDAAVNDIIEMDEHLICITEAEDYHRVLSQLNAESIEIEESQIAMRAQNLISVSGDTAETLEKLIDALEDLDDVQDVFYNAEFI